MTFVTTDAKCGQHLQDLCLTCKPSKCKFEVLQTEYLRHVIAEGHVAMDPAKVAGVAEWLVPTCKRDVQQFLGGCNFY